LHISALAGNPKYLTRNKNMMKNCLHSRDASCTIDERCNSVSVAWPGHLFRPGDFGRAGRGAMDRAQQ